MFGEKRAAAKDTCMLVTGSIVEFVPVGDLTAELVCTPKGDYPRQHMRELVRPDGGRVFLAETDLPARMQAEDVRRLRHSTVLTSLFHSRMPDITKVPWQLWVLCGVLLAIVAFK